MIKQVKYIPGGVYHVYNHGVGDEDIFRNEDNFLYFLKKYKEKVTPVVNTLAYCLMPNHFHLLFTVKEENELLKFYDDKKKKKTTLKLPDNVKTDSDLFHHIVHRQFHNLTLGYSKAFNKYHNRKGTLIRQNTRRKLVNDRPYLLNAIRYVNMNAVLHGFVSSLSDWPYSSYFEGLSDQSDFISNTVMSYFDDKSHYVKFHNDTLKDFCLEKDLESYPTLLSTQARFPSGLSLLILFLSIS